MCCSNGLFYLIYMMFFLENINMERDDDLHIVQLFKNL
jgi:hypothetical protein